MDRPGNAAMRRRLLRMLPLAAALGLLALGYALGWQRHLSLDALGDSGAALQAWVAANPVLAPAAYFLLYVVAAAVAFPAAGILTVAGGFLFGPVLGSALVAGAATLGACLLFLSVRFALSDVVRRRLGGRAQALAAGFERDAFGYLLVLRLAPVFPFWLVNVAPALFRVPLRTFALATLLGILPGVAAYCWLGAGLGSVVEAARRHGREAGLGDLVTPQITVAFVLLALVAALALVVRNMRANRTDRDGPNGAPDDDEA